MKGYWEQKYECSVVVRVQFLGQEVFEDEIKGLNEGHALYLARLNWPEAHVEVVAYRMREVA